MIRVEQARERQEQRFFGTEIPFNAGIPGGHVEEYCEFSNDCFAHYKRVIQQSDISTRSMDRLAKVARTIADLNGSDRVEPPHVDDAKSFVVGGLLRDAF
ncbi:MAG: hypothetical protein IH899_00145 [Planctomycetes bacterium]|nr:hypothetical protein [Planctomycetota bacterium]